MASLDPQKIDVYHVFLASPGDCAAERQHVRRFFERFNRQAAVLWSTRFEVVDWENYATIGVGRPQELITRQTLERFRNSLALVIGVMAQRFGSPTGECESGTEEEFNWAFEANAATGFPEIKWFFRRIDQFQAPPDLDEAQHALEQWAKVRAFRNRLQSAASEVFYAEYSASFQQVFEEDLQRWLTDPDRPWAEARARQASRASRLISPPVRYFETLERDFGKLDISGIDKDETFDIPLSEIYVRLRVMFDEGTQERVESQDGEPLDIQAAILKFRRLVIVGDPGSGKSTFLRYIALMIAKSVVSGNSAIAMEKISLAEPLPLPLFVSCWDLSDELKMHQVASLETVIAFIAKRLAFSGYDIAVPDLTSLLASGQCCLLFDGLDEVPTDKGRALVSRLLMQFVSQFGENRYVVTSRVRAYTGETVLGAGFVRCDIQPFDERDRNQFLRNWVSLLFRVPPGGIEAEAREAAHEFTSLTRAIEGSDRIRPLAVNPLLLTVIAIVHWNRKRLPEQRVDLYDECVEVLLGQRKTAERTQLGKAASAMDVQAERREFEELAWVRKRFAEIALHIQRLDGDSPEATKDDVVKVLVPHFIDQGAVSREQAEARAELFLDKQELQSGLLVSRRHHSYRFVHLTFQEFLAARQLSNMEFDQVTAVIEPSLRTAKWFECLQLLGALWAKNSDVQLRRYIGWLLDHAGDSIDEKAPVMALTASIVRDIRGVADLNEELRTRFEIAVKATLDVFSSHSKVPTHTQMEILEALGRLGAAVKQHLIAAASARHYPVRRRAIEMLLPHVSDDELFNKLRHVLGDSSREPIGAYLNATIQRDRKRAAALIDEHRFRYKIRDGISILPPETIGKGDALARQLLNIRALNGSGGRHIRVRLHALRTLAQDWWDADVEKLLRDVVLSRVGSDLQKAALRLLIECTSEASARDFISQHAFPEKSDIHMYSAVEILCEFWPDEGTHSLLAARLSAPDAPHIYARQFAFHWRTRQSQQLLIDRMLSAVTTGSAKHLPEVLAEYWKDDVSRDALERVLRESQVPPLRGNALAALAENWADDRSTHLVREFAQKDANSHVRITALRHLLWRLPAHWTDQQKSFVRSMTGYLDTQPHIYADPWTPIGEFRVSRAVNATRMSEAETESALSLLAQHLGWDIRTGAQKGAAP